MTIRKERKEENRMADFVQKEKVTGTMKDGTEVRFNREWAGHRFDDEEVKKLLAGETIHIKAKSKKGKDFECDGDLEQQEFDGHKFWGFKPDFD